MLWPVLPPDPQKGNRPQRNKIFFDNVYTLTYDVFAYNMCASSPLQGLGVRCPTKKINNLNLFKIGVGVLLVVMFVYPEDGI